MFSNTNYKALDIPHESKLHTPHDTFESISIVWWLFLFILLTLCRIFGRSHLFSCKIVKIKRKRTTRLNQNACEHFRDVVFIALLIVEHKNKLKLSSRKKRTEKERKRLKRMMNYIPIKYYFKNRHWKSHVNIQHIFNIYRMVCIKFKYFKLK